MVELKRTVLDIIQTLRVQSHQNMFWFKGPPPNFGDWIGPYIYQARTGREPRFRPPRNRRLSTVFLTVGSLAHVICEDTVVWGTGIMWRNSDFRRPYMTLAVRGPLSRQRFLELGYSCPEVYGDPAILLPLYYTPQPVRGRPIGIVPHYFHYEEAMRLYGGDKDISIIDVRGSVEDVIDAITSCEFVVSSSLHGLIIAHSYGRPAARVEFTRKLAGDGVKFEDYYRAGGVANPPHSLNLSARVPTPEICSFVRASPLPELNSLSPRLLETCPF